MRLLALIRAMLSLRLLSALAALLIPAAAIAEPGDVQTAWRLLDYMAVDYGGAVANGAVLKASEYAEMQEFSATAERQLGELPDQTDKGRLLQQATALRAAVAAKADPASVAKLAHALSSAVQKAYPFPVAPTAMPVKPFSAIGVSRTRRSPYFSARSFVTL